MKSSEYRGLGLMNLFALIPQLIMLLIEWHDPMNVGHALQIAVFSLTLHNLMDISKRIIENRTENGK